MSKPLPSPELLRQLLRYEPDTGKLFWLPRVERTKGDKIFNVMFAGKEAFTASSNGYKVGRYKDKMLSAHRVIWAIVHGTWPEQQIDHINQIRFDNRLCNLREVTNRENHCNKQKSARNKSGVTGVCYDAKNRRWHAQIGVEGTTRHLGWYTDFDSAVDARKAAEREVGLFTEQHGKHLNYRDCR